MRSSFVSSLVLAVSLVLTGCAAQVDHDPAAESPAASVEALTTFGKKLVGDFHYDTAHNFYENISLKSNGKYTAAFKPCPPTAKCATYPESGTWKAKSSTTLKLSPSQGSDKVFTISIAGDGSGFKMETGGQVEGLVRDAAPVLTCATDADCASGEECRFVSNCPPAPPGGVTCFSGQDKCVAVAALGQSCGFRTQSVQCKRDLDCRHVAGPLDSLTCAPHLAQYGEPCGGFVMSAAVCADGLACTHLDAKGNLIGNPDVPGVCRVDLDGQCGGKGGLECAYPMHCESLTATTPGNCVKLEAPDPHRRRCVA